MADALAAGRVAIRDFRDLKVWQVAMQLSDLVTAMTRLLPQPDRMVFEVQMRCAALSIAANIAEGEQRHHLGDYLRHLSFARGSTGELRTFIVALGRSVPDRRGAAAEAEVLADRLGRMLTRMSQTLRLQWIKRRPARRETLASGSN